MTLKIWEWISIILAAMVSGMFCGPWVALSRSMKTFGPEVFLAIGHRLVKNVGPVMTILMPAALLSILPVLITSYSARPSTFYAFSAGFVLFIVALLVTLRFEALSPCKSRYGQSQPYRTTGNSFATAGERSMWCEC
jgi:hypothetical protein